MTKSLGTAALCICILLLSKSAAFAQQVIYEDHTTYEYGTVYINHFDYNGHLRISGSTMEDRILVYEQEVDSYQLTESSLNQAIYGSNYQFNDRLSVWPKPSMELVVEARDRLGKLINSRRISKNEVSLIIINSGRRDDEIIVKTDVPCWINSGDGFDIIHGGNGPDYIENPRGGGTTFGHGGDDIIVGNTTGGGYFGTGIYMLGGAGEDTYIFNYQDWIIDELNGNIYSWPGGITPVDLIYGSGHFSGMSQATLDENFQY